MAGATYVPPYPRSGMGSATTFPGPAEDRTAASLVHRGVLVMIVSVVSGLLLAMAAFPFVGGLGLVAKTGINAFNKLPSELIEPPLPQRSRILAADGSPLAEVFLNEDRVQVPLARIHKSRAELAFIAIEDTRFYSHGGIDPIGTLRALIHNTESDSQQGGSTLTQQYVKNVLIESAPDAKSRADARRRALTRKIKEARYALALERRLKKDQILERYLNIVYFGESVYGIGTASLHYFGHPVEQLKPWEAALLAGMVKNPSAYDPHKNPKRATARRNLVLAKMYDAGFIKTERALRIYQKVPLKRTLKPKPESDFFKTSYAPFFLDYFLQQAREDKQFGVTPEERYQTLFQGGLTIKTTLDPRLQRIAQSVLDAQVGDRTKQPGVGVVVIEPGTGAVKAMAVNRDFSTFHVNLATGRGGTGLQGGSTFKVFVLTAALEKKIPLSLHLYAPAKYHSTTLNNPQPDDVYHNAGDSEAGDFDIPKGTWHSVNTFFVQLEERTGVLAAVDVAKRLGVALPFDQIGAVNGSFTLGANYITPLEEANAYATFAAHGLYCAPRAIAQIVLPSGKTRDEPNKCSQVIDPKVADTVTSVLEGVLTKGTATRAYFGRPAAGKTGTTNGYGSAWFVGYTPELACAVGMGDTRGSAYPLQAMGRFRRIYGGTVPALIWHDIMSQALAGLPVHDFPKPPAVSTVDNPKVPDVTGLSVPEAQAALTAAGYGSVIELIPVDAGPTIPAGRVAATDPVAGTIAPRGTTVIILVSSGHPPPTETATPLPTDFPSGNHTPDPTVSPNPSPTPRPSRTRKPHG